MPGWRIEVVALAPPTTIAPGTAPIAWALPQALADLGHEVRVLYPTVSEGPAPSLRRAHAVPLGSAANGRREVPRTADFGRRVAAEIDRSAQLWLGFDPAAGAIPAARGRGPARAYVAETIALDSLVRPGVAGARSGLRERVGGWLDRRTLRGLEETAVRRADAVFATRRGTGERLAELYEVPSRAIHEIPPGVPAPLDVGTKAQVRLGLHVPPDVPVAAFVGRDPAAEGLETALAAFRKVRVLFAGARFLVAGASLPPEPGVLCVGANDADARARVLRAADVLLFPAGPSGTPQAPWDALGYGIAMIVSARVPRDGLDDPRAIRTAASDDVGDYASELAELLADPALRRTLGEAAKACAASLTFDRMAERVEKVLRPIVGDR